MTQRIGGRLFSDAGQMQALDASGGVPAGAVMLGGWATKSSGEPYVHDLAGSTVPATAVFIGGFAHHQDGRRYVTTDAPSGAKFLGPIAVRADGAMHTNANAVGATDVFFGGWAIKSDGPARVLIS